MDFLGLSHPQYEFQQPCISGYFSIRWKYRPLAFKVVRIKWGLTCLKAHKKLQHKWFDIVIIEES